MHHGGATRSGRRGRRGLALASVLGLLALGGLAYSQRDALVTRYHQWRLARDPGSLHGYLAAEARTKAHSTSPAGEASAVRRAIARFAASPAGKSALARALLHEAELVESLEPGDATDSELFIVSFSTGESALECVFRHPLRSGRRRHPIQPLFHLAETVLEELELPFIALVENHAVWLGRAADVPGIPCVWSERDDGFACVVTDPDATDATRLESLRLRTTLRASKGSDAPELREPQQRLVDSCRDAAAFLRELAAVVPSSAEDASR